MLSPHINDLIAEWLSLAGIVLLVSFGVWDLFVVLVLERGKPFRDRLASGYTVSYQTYLAANAYPPLMWFLGVFAALMAVYGWRGVTLGWWLFNGHSVLSMRGVS